MLILVYFRCLIPIFLYNISHYSERDKGENLMPQTEKTFPRWIPRWEDFRQYHLRIASLCFQCVHPPPGPVRISVPDVAMAYALICLIFGLMTFSAGRQRQIRFEKSRACGRDHYGFRLFMVSTITSGSCRHSRAVKRQRPQAEALASLPLLWGHRLFRGGMRHFPRSPRLRSGGPTEGRLQLGSLLWGSVWVLL